MSSSSTKSLLKKGERLVAPAFECLIKLAAPSWVSSFSGSNFSREFVVENDDGNNDNDVSFLTIINEDSHGTVANTLRIFLEEETYCCSYFLPRVCDQALRSLTGCKNREIAVELFYGNGYKTLIMRKDNKRNRPSSKSSGKNKVDVVKSLEIYLSMGDEVDKYYMNQEADRTANKKNNKFLPSPAILSPSTDLYSHLRNKMAEKMADGEIHNNNAGDKTHPPVIVLYLWTNFSKQNNLFTHPIIPSRESFIELSVPISSSTSTHTNCWRYATYDGNRIQHPNQWLSSSTRQKTGKMASTSSGVVKKKEIAKKNNVKIGLHCTKIAKKRKRLAGFANLKQSRNIKKKKSSFSKNDMQQNNKVYSTKKKSDKKPTITSATNSLESPKNSSSDNSKKRPKSAFFQQQLNDEETFEND